MDCREISEYIAAAIDREVEKTIEVQLKKHFEVCPRCRGEFELHQIIKDIVKTRLPRAKAPRVLFQSISKNLSAKTTLLEVLNNWLKKYTIKHTWKTTLSLGGAFAVIIALLISLTKSHHSHAQPNDGNIINQTYNNFDAVLQGRIVPQERSGNPEILEEYFILNGSFCVTVPRLKRCTLSGGVLTKFLNEDVAHLLYRYDDDVIYLFQADMRSVVDNKTFYLPAAVWDTIERAGHYIENHSSNCTLMIWIVDSTICCAIADIEKDKLLVSFKESY